MSKIQIRQGLFETNSSSEHTITIVDAEDFESWKKDKVWYNTDEEHFLQIDKAIDANIEILEHDFLGGKKKLPESFKDKYRELKNFEEAYNETKDNFDFDFDYEDIKWDWESFYISREAWRKSSNDDFEDFYQPYTTKNGDKIVAFGYYGYC